MTPERFGEVVELVVEAAPDLVLITGDFIDRQTNLAELSAYTDLLSKITAPLGKYGVLGNHDHWRRPEITFQMMDESGIEDVSNRSIKLGDDQDALYICGLDSYVEGRQDLGKVLSDLPDEYPSILLIHEPDFADISAGSGRFSLQLSGHSHGGQVYVPLFGPPVTPKYAKKYPRGRYRIGEMDLYTSPGIGMVEPFVRLNCRPEIGLFTLEPGEGQA
jgi:predicted MPP superfamily phosphohydrolase